AEIWRVLKPDGLVCAETPFMQQVHGGCYDFIRFSLLGHRRLFQAFEEVRSGIAVGPGTALAWSWTYFLTSFCGTGRLRPLAHAAGYRVTGTPTAILVAAGGDIAAPPAEGASAIRTLLAKSSRNAPETVPFNDRRVA